MKTNKLTLLSLVLFILLKVMPANSYAQVSPSKKADTLREKIEKIKKIETEDNKIITDENFDRKIDSVLNSVSGFTYKNGKATRTAASIDDKSLTFNVNLLDKKWYTLQLTGSGAAEKSVVDVFKDGKYQKTLTAGFNAIIFLPFNKAAFRKSDKTELSAAILTVDSYYTQKLGKCPAGSDIDFLINEYSKGNEFLLGKTAIPIKEVDTYDEKRAKLLKLIETFKEYLPEKFLELPFPDQRTAVDNLLSQKNTICENMWKQKELDSLNRLQLNTKFTGTVLSWLTLNGKYNNEKYPVFDQSDTTDYASPYNDHYFSYGFGFNFAYIRKKVTYWFSPSLKFKNSRDFDEENLRYLNIPKGTKTINGTPQNEYVQTSYYNQIADVKAFTNMELPLIIYWPKSQFGFDLAINADIAPKWENAGARLGIFIPIPSGEQKIIIEPMVKLKKLDKKDLDFKKDQISFGINLTVTLPEFITGKKK